MDDAYVILSTITVGLACACIARWRRRRAEGRAYVDRRDMRQAYLFIVWCAFWGSGIAIMLAFIWGGGRLLTWGGLQLLAGAAVGLAFATVYVWAKLGLRFDSSTWFRLVILRRLTDRPEYQNPKDHVPGRPPD